jgi:hypothetical protein
MHHAHRSTRSRRYGSARGLRMAAGLLVAGGSLCLFLGSPASAATVNGVATIAAPGSVPPIQPLLSGGSTTQFTVALPANANCSGDTASGGYHVYSYLVPKGTDVTTLDFAGSAPPSQSFGFVNDIGTYYGPVNTAVKTGTNPGQIIGIPNDFEWAPLVTDDNVTVSTLTTSGTTPGTWEAGLLCANSNSTPAGAVTDNWNTEVTFTASTSDPTGFVWSATPGGGSTTTTTTTTAAPTSTTTTTVATTSTTQAGSAGSTTSTTTAVGGTVAGSSTGGGSSSDGTSSTSGTSGPLAFTGAPVTKYLGAGMLGIGIALILLGWGNRRVRLARATRESPH